MLKRKFNDTDLPWLLKCLEDDPDDHDKLYEQVCKIYNRRGDFEEALAVATDRITRFPEKTDGYTYALITLAAMGDRTRTEILSRQLKRIDPHHEFPAKILKEFDARALQGKITCLVRDEQWDDALEAMDKKIEMDLENGYSHQQNITLLKKLKKPDDVIIAAMDALISIAPKEPRAHQQKITFLKKRNKSADIIIEAMDALILIEPDNRRSLQQKITFLKEQERPEDPEEQKLLEDNIIMAMDAQILIDPQNECSHQQKVTFLEKVGQHKEAITALRSLIDICEDPEEAAINWSNMARLQRDIGNFKAAINAVNMAINLTSSKREKANYKIFRTRIIEERDNPPLSSVEEGSDASSVPVYVDQYTGEEYTI